MSTTTSRTVTVVRTRDGVSNPRWREQIRNGQNATTTLTGVWDSCEAGNVGHAHFYGRASNGNYIEMWHDGSYGVCQTAWSPTIPSFTLSTTTAQNRASAKFYKKLRSEAVQMSGPTFLGELRETARMLRHPASALWSKNKGYLDRLTKEKRRNPKSWMQAAGGLWLEHAFGWTPLLNDCRDIVQAFHRLNEPRFARGVVGSYKDSRDTSSTLASPHNLSGPTQLAPSQFWGRFRSTRQEWCVVKYKGALKAQTDGWTPWSRESFGLFGFTPDEFIPTAWELLPWSFLADYFANIGDILTCAVTDTSRIMFACQTIVRWTGIHSQFIFDWPRTMQAFSGYPLDVTYDGDPCPIQYSRKTVSRGATSGVPLPRFQLSWDLGDGQLGNIAALLTQAQALHPQSNRRNWHR